VNTQITSTWATGSAGGRVAYSSQIIANAQSASATLTLNAGAGATLAGGTASLAAGLIRIGTNAAHTISSTGSFGAMVLVAPLNTPAFSLRSGSFEVTTPQGSGSFYTNLPITSSGARINGDGRFSGIEVIGLVGANGSGSVYVENAITASVVSASQYIGTIQSASYAITASFALNAGGAIDTGSFATTGSNTFQSTQYIVSGAISGTFVDNAGSIYTQSSAVRHIVNLGSASFASIIIPDDNTLYVVDGDETYVLNSQTSSFATTGSNRFVGNQTITGSLTLSSSAAIELTVIGDTIVSGTLALTGSSPTHTFLSGGINYSGSIVSTATDTYPSAPQGNFIVTLSSASMATLLSGAGTNANTIYFVI
jgi:hypothetical protein